MNKYTIYNSLLAFFIVTGLYNLPGCTVLIDVTTAGEPTSTGEENLTGDICGDCAKSSLEECDPCLYKDQFMSRCENVETARCELVYDPNPQLDCTNNWLGDVGCGQEEADLLCKILIKNPKAVAKDFNVGAYILTRGLISNQLVSKDGVELISISDEIYPTLFYYESNPYLVPTITLEISDDVCIVE